MIWEERSRRGRLQVCGRRERRFIMEGGRRNSGAMKLVLLIGSPNEMI